MTKHWTLYVLGRFFTVTSLLIYIKLSEVALQVMNWIFCLMICNHTVSHPFQSFLRLLWFQVASCLGSLVIKVKGYPQKMPIDHKQWVGLGANNQLPYLDMDIIFLQHVRYNKKNKLGGHNTNQNTSNYYITLIIVETPWFIVYVSSSYYYLVEHAPIPTFRITVG